MWVALIGLASSLVSQEGKSAQAQADAEAQARAQQQQVYMMTAGLVLAGIAGAVLLSGRRHR